MAKQKYYTTTQIDKTSCTYRIIIGIRSNGKTTAVLGKILKWHCDTNFSRSGCYIRRYREDLRGNSEVTQNLVTLGWVEKYSKGKYNAIRYYQNKWNLVKLNAKGEQIEVCPTPFMYAFCLSEQERYKSKQYPTIDIIVEDEFLTRNYYLKDEFIMFQNLISTIIRDRSDVVIYMLGNTVNKYCPYFEEMGLTNIAKQKQGTIDLYTYGKDERPLVAVEYCEGVAKENNFYFAFNNPRLAMITQGTWEIDIYPHLPFKYEISDKLFSFFIDFKKNILEGEVIFKDDNLFIYLHKKTTPIKEEIYPVYSLNPSPKRNYSVNIFKPSNDVERLIANLFIRKKVFYQTNEVGEIVRNWLMEQK